MSEMKPDIVELRWDALQSRLKEAACEPTDFQRSADPLRQPSSDPQRSIDEELPPWWEEREPPLLGGFALQGNGEPKLRVVGGLRRVVPVNKLILF